MNLSRDCARLLNCTIRHVQDGNQTLISAGPRAALDMPFSRRGGSGVEGWWGRSRIRGMVKAASPWGVGRFDCVNRTRATQASKVPALHLTPHPPLRNDVAFQTANAHKQLYE